MVRFLHTFSSFLKGGFTVTSLLLIVSQPEHQAFDSCATPHCLSSQVPRKANGIEFGMETGLHGKYEFIIRDHETQEMMLFRVTRFEQTEHTSFNDGVSRDFWR